MKNRFEIEPPTLTCTWCFDCVPEENSPLLNSGTVQIEIPSGALIRYNYKPEALQTAPGRHDPNEEDKF